MNERVKRFPKLKNMKILKIGVAPRRSGLKFIHAFPMNEPIVAMIQYNGTIYIATSKGIYKKTSDDKVEHLKLEISS